MMKFRKWEESGDQKRFRYFEQSLNLSCSAYNSIDLITENLAEAQWEQSAGTVDKKGKEIFQGDIAKSVWGIGLVVKTENGFEFETSEMKVALWMATVGSNGWEFEVVGNIHETPDLLPKLNE